MVLKCYHHFDQSHQVEATSSQANLDAMNNPTWYINTYASHCMTLDLSNLYLNSSYNGYDQVTIRDGLDLVIKIIGHSQYFSYFYLSFPT